MAEKETAYQVLESTLRSVAQGRGPGTVYPTGTERMVAALALAQMLRVPEEQFSSSTTGVGIEAMIAKCLGGKD